MTTLLQCTPELTLADVEEGRRFVPEPIACCRFCKCTREKPCEIYLRHARDGKAYLVRVRVAATTVRECEWFAAGVCNAPLCIEKLVQESREIFWTGEGNPVRRMGA